MPLAREIYLDALTAAVFAGRLGGGCDARQVATVARAAPPPPSPPRAVDLLLDGLALLITEGHTAATPALRKALTAFHSDEIGTEEGLRWLWLAGRTAGFIWDYESWDSLTARQVRAAREVGALGHLPLAFSTRVGVHLFAGELQAAASLVEQSDALAEATYGRIVPLYGALALAAFRGSEDEVTRLVRTNTQDFIARGEGIGLTVSQWVTAVLYNGLARYEDAFAAAADATTDPHELWFSTFAMVELIEAASRSGRADRAAEALELLSESTRASGTPWALGVEARSRALLDRRGSSRGALPRGDRSSATDAPSSGPGASSSALRGVAATPTPPPRCTGSATGRPRALLRLRDGGVRRARAAVELQATGEHARKRTVDTRDQLTPQEAQISRLAARGRHEPRDRRSAVHQPEHGRVPPPQGVPEARREVTHAARPPDVLGRCIAVRGTPVGRPHDRFAPGPRPENARFWNRPWYRGELRRQPGRRGLAGAQWADPRSLPARSARKERSR